MPSANNPRYYRSWSLIPDRAFVLALAISVLWHFFWFFSVRIVVSTPRKVEKARPELVSLRPAIDDALFKTLVDTKPEITQSFYRRPADFEAAADLPPQAAERYSPGDIVSVPFGKRFLATLKNFVGGVKPSSDFDLTEEERKKRLRLMRNFEE